MDQNPGCWQRLVIEKPFGKDLESSEALADELNTLFPEEQLYRIDHYLGKELMQVQHSLPSVPSSQAEQCIMHDHFLMLDTYDQCASCLPLAAGTQQHMTGRCMLARRLSALISTSLCHAAHAL